MKAYRDLRRRVEAGEITLLHIDAVPRSISTALGRALATASDVAFVNEPFNRFSQDVDTAAGHILAAYSEAERQDAPAVIVTKSMSRRLPQDAFELWAPLCERIIYPIRDPLIQMGSLVTRIANDFFVAPGADALSQEAVYPYLGAVTEFLARDNFAQSGWAATESHARAVQEHKDLVVVSTTGLTLAPMAVMSGLCDRMGLPFQPEMVERWKGLDRFKNVPSYPDQVDEEGVSLNAWIRSAVTTTSIRPNTRAALDLDRVPHALREHIETVAQPAYAYLCDAGASCG